MLELVKASPVWKLLKDMKEMVGVLAFYWAFTELPLVRPQLELSYSSERRFVPVRTLYHLDQWRGADSLNKSVQAVRNFMESPEMLAMTFVVNGPAAVTDFDLKINGITEPSEVVVESSSSRITERAEQIVVYSVLPDSSISFPALNNLPGRSVTQLVVWGRFHNQPFKSRVDVASSARSMRTSSFYKASRMAYFIDDHFGEICVVLAGIGLVAGLSRFRQREHATA